MRLDELTTLNDILKSDQYIKLLSHLNAGTDNDINVTQIKNKVIQSWKRGMKSRKHYDDLLNSIDISINDLIDK